VTEVKSSKAEQQPCPVVGLLLAGGLATRMGGGDKCLLPLAGKSLLQRAIERAAPQVEKLVLNANGDQQRFAAVGLPVVADIEPGFAGPLAGIHAGMVWAQQHHADCRWLASFATDTPFFPADLVVRLHHAAEHDESRIAIACAGKYRQPVFALWSLDLVDELALALREGVRKIDRWAEQFSVSWVDFGESVNQQTDPFFNINCPEDLTTAEQLLAEQ